MNTNIARRTFIRLLAAGGGSLAFPSLIPPEVLAQARLLVPRSDVSPAQGGRTERLP
jgi:hypothetical protein